RPSVGGSDRVVRLAHAPDDRRRLLGREHLGDALQLVTGDAGNRLHLVGGVLRDFLADLFHSVDALGDEFLVFPAVLEDVPEHAPDQRDVGAGPEPRIFRGVRGGAGEPGVHDDQVAIVQLLAFEQVLHGDRMRLGRVSAQNEHRLGVADVVVRIGHRAVAPGIGYAGNRRRMADTRLMVLIVRPPQGSELAEEIRAFVGELRRSHPVDGFRTGLLATLEKLVADAVDCLVPRDALPLTADQLHWIFQAAVAVHELAYAG